MTATTTEPAMSETPDISVVIPLLNESESLPELAAWIDRVMTANRFRYEAIFIDDGSSDTSWNVIRSLSATNPSVRGIRFRRNYGKSAALYCGFEAARGEVVITMDADLQDDVNAVDEFIDGFCNGNEIVYGVRSARKKDTWFKRTTAEAFYKVFEWMGAETVPDHADYRLMSRETLDALSEYHEVNLFLRGIVPTLGYQTSKVYYERGEREAGESKYPLKKMIAFAIQGITSFSTKPLSFVTGAGLLSILVAIGMFVYVLVSLGFGHAIAGWGSMMISIWLIGGLIMLSLGIVGEYVGKIYMESKHRPRYRIETTL